MMKFNKIQIISLLLIFYFTYMQSAHAYLDPGTGSILIQGLIAAIAGGLFTIRLYWQKFKNLFQRSAKNNEEEGTDPSLDTETKT